MKARKLVVKRHQSSTCVSRVHKRKQSGGHSGCQHEEDALTRRHWMRVSYAVTARDERTVCGKSKCRFASYECRTCGKSSHLAEGNLQRKITNLKSWARVFSFVAGKTKVSEQGKYNASERVQISDSRCGRARLVAFLGVRNHQPIASRISLRLDLSSGVRAVPVWPPDLSGRSAVSSRRANPRSCGSCQV